MEDNLSVNCYIIHVALMDVQQSSPDKSARELSDRVDRYQITLYFLSMTLYGLQAEMHDVFQGCDSPQPDISPP